MTRRRFRTLMIWAGMLWPIAASGQTAPKLELKPNDRIVFVGNTFAERLAMFGDFETIALAAKPELQLTFRSLAWSGDEIATQLRPLNFGDMRQHLTEQKPDMIFLCFGMSESFEGEAGLPSFESGLRQLVTELSGRSFNDKKTPPRLVLVSPIAHERLGGRLPDPGPHNEQLRAYSQAMAKVAASTKTVYLDLFEPTLKLMQAQTTDQPRLTSNGIHLAPWGSWIVAQLMARQLGLGVEPPVVALDAKNQASIKTTATEPRLPLPAPPQSKAEPIAGFTGGLVVKAENLPPGRYALTIDGKLAAIGDQDEWLKGVRVASGSPQEQADRLRDAVQERGRQFFYRYRAVNGEYIYGRRREPFGVQNFPDEMKTLDRMVRELDQLTWYLAKPKPARTFELAPAPGDQ